MGRVQSKVKYCKKEAKLPQHGTGMHQSVHPSSPFPPSTPVLSYLLKCIVHGGEKIAILFVAIVVDMPVECICALLHYAPMDR